ncbi:uncharacterized protein TM35_000053650 [Trypanosoma theileri]|uniref:CBF1-interacting co-repressor CIR N-terminal domain-containing protein n=1 Tax=Trypanosoma theileri TaxID=67003 RepID=A0A1X0P5E5_9TRYP|nr:uncharacterized protein TM35_000053650 [Trypanosoma theileri]ORC91769.1 hypothetical protein TM35_000053650 [Trypanosoma theileri]
MYASHKKDINRHKSFHPLTYRNLSKVEHRQEQEEARKKLSDERNVQLRRDQEQRRYDDLVLAASADSVSGQLAKFRQVENIFAAENKVVSKGSSATVDSGMSDIAPTLLKTSSSLTFKKEEGENDVEIKREERKRGREEDEPSSSSDNNNNKKVVTGFLSSSDAAQLRKELDKLQKERHDPLRRIERFQNRTVAAEAKRRALESKMNTVHSNNPSDSNGSAHTEKDVIRSRIQELLELKRQK